jgi:hypothetical protein
MELIPFEPERTQCLCSVPDGELYLFVNRTGYRICSSCLDKFGIIYEMEKKERQMEHIEISAHVQRMRTEYEELEKKCRDLEKFVKSNPIFETLGADERADMVEQLHYMNQYRVVLMQRLARALGNV